MTSVSETTNIDEFGRDMSLRKTANEIASENFINEITNKLKNMSWAEYTYELEEEEERKQEEEKRFQEEKERVVRLAADQERKILLAKGEYDLEEGEILE